MKLLYLCSCHPQTWDEAFEAEGKDQHRKGILNMTIHEDVKLELCKLLHHMNDVQVGFNMMKVSHLRLCHQVRHRVESIVAFAHGYMGDLQTDQLRRYIEIKQSDMPSAVAAKKTKEFRCPPREQMNTILNFKSIEDEEELAEHACNDYLRGRMSEFHDGLMTFLSIASLEAEDGADAAPSDADAAPPSLMSSLMTTLKAAQGDKGEEESGEEPHVKSREEKFRKVLIDTVIRWGSEAEIENKDLVREMFSLLLRQYDTVSLACITLRSSHPAGGGAHEGQRVVIHH